METAHLLLFLKAPRELLQTISPQIVSLVEFSFAWCHPLEAKCDAVAVYGI